jgi:glutaconyl-CoA/methylmalonyl-CoA decarboxylase subunit gamma
MRFRRSGDGSEFEVEVLSHDRGSVRARIDGREVDATVQPLPDGSSILATGARRVRVFGTRRGSSILVAAGPLAVELNPVEGRSSRAAHGLAAPEIAAPMPGKVLKVLVKEGDQIEAGQPLITIEAMKMETTLSAETPAIVKKVLVATGDMIDHGQVMIELSPVPGSSRPRSTLSAP